MIKAGDVVRIANTVHYNKPVIDNTALIGVCIGRTKGQPEQLTVILSCGMPFGVPEDWCKATGKTFKYEALKREYLEKFPDSLEKS